MGRNVVEIDENLRLIGTAHVSTASVELVREQIAEFKPDLVAVELCQSRLKSLKTPDELDDKIIEMINTDRPVIFDCLVDKEENCFPMIPSGKPHNQMLLGPKDQKENKITKKGRTLV